MSSSVDTGIKDGVFDVDNWISANGQINSLEICAYFGMHMWSWIGQTVSCDDKMEKIYVS